MALGLGLGLQFRRNTGGELDPDYQAVLDYATAQGYTLPSAGQQTLQNQLVVDLKTAGVWSKLDAFSVFATDGDGDFALIDWVRLVTQTAVSSPTFTANKGFETDGISSYIDTLYNPTTDGVNYSGENAGRLIYANPDVTPTFRFDGVAGSNNNRMRPADVASHYINGVNNFVNGSFDLTGAGIKAITRQANFGSTGNYTLMSDSVIESRVASPNLDIPNTTQLIGRSNTAYGNILAGIYAIGGDFSAEYFDFRTAIETYITSL